MEPLPPTVPAPPNVQLQNVQLQMRLPPDLHAALKELALEDNRSLNGEIVHLLRQAVQKQSSGQVEQPG